MSKEKATIIFTHPCKSQDKWDIAISDAEKKIQDGKKKIARLRESIRAFRELRDSGDPFPGEAESDVAQ